MYRTGECYDQKARLVIDIYIDYDIKTFPIDEKDVCHKLGIKLIPYSTFIHENRSTLTSKSAFSFYVPPIHNMPPMIFYNDNIFSMLSRGNIRRNIFHEVKHYICNETKEEPEDDDLADYFGKYFLAPIPYLIYEGIDDANQIIANFCVDSDMASYIIKNINNRKKRYGNKIFDYEKPLLEHLLGDKYIDDEGGDAN